MQWSETNFPYSNSTKSNHCALSVHLGLHLGLALLEVGRHLAIVLVRVGDSTLALAAFADADASTALRAFTALKFTSLRGAWWVELAIR